MMFGRTKAMKPFTVTAASRVPVMAIFLTFALISATTILLSVSATKGSQHRTSVIEVAARERTLAERYVEEILLVREGRQADPAYTAGVLATSATALLEGGTVPAVNGDDDESSLPPADGRILRAQFAQEQHLVADLAATGQAVLQHRPTANLPETAHERVSQLEPIMRLRVLSALTSSVAFRAAQEIGRVDEANINNLVVNQVLLGVGGLLITLLLASVLLFTTRRQSAHFRSLALSSSDLVIVLGPAGCRYVSRSVITLVGKPGSELHGSGLARFVHEDDRGVFDAVQATGAPPEFSFRMLSGAGEWRHLDARVTDLRNDRNLRGIVLNARDTTERVELEHQLTAQLQRDGFASRLGEALEMADEEREVFNVVELATLEISEQTPMELLLSDSSRANLSRVATSPGVEAPGCQVKSPFSCVAVRRGTAAVFDSSESLNACPQLRGRASGPCSAVCVPVSFMGHALGVLHTTGPDGKALSAEAVSQLTMLAGQAGARIGTVRAFEKTQLQASTDSLTGLVNRRTAEKELRELMKSARPFAVVIADLDRFKQLNDRHGHEAGDRALRLFSQTAKQAMRDNDLVARWGGEEFVMVLPDLDRFQAVNVLERVRHDLTAAHSGATLRFTASFGVADSDQADSLEELLTIADGGLYESKERGRDRVTVGDSKSAAKAKADGIAKLDDSPKTTPANGHPGDENGIVVTRHAHASLHEAAYEEEPPPSGVQIR
jgi:diguanylate cyclase (GGDEF)-like protein/PAS domain S-box-containing protein